ncbi:MAG TPA: Ni/Fe hydrogenase subunit gamma [Peptococcaceae bacterium]|nr:Ni/Fe hydrogenase subunit gamma [Peptococcaceae bacterium]
MPSMVKIIDVTEETKDTKTIKLTFVDDEVRNKFSFKPGQFNMLTVLGVGEAPLSISSDPGEKEYFSHTIRRVGNVTGAITKLCVGDTFGARGPYGNGWPMDKIQDKNILIIAGGIGLAPLRPVIYSIKNERENYGKMEILYGARTPGDCLYRREYDEWKKIPHTRLLLTVDSVPEGMEWEHDVGVVTLLFDKISLNPTETAVLICGPEIMMKFSVQKLLEMGFKDKDIYLSMERRMNCGISKCGLCQIGPKFVCQDGPVFSYFELCNLTEKIF